MRKKRNRFLISNNLDMWHLLLYVNKEEWRDIEMPDDSELPEVVMWFCLCTDEKFDDVM